MRTRRDLLWTWFLPERRVEPPGELWLRHGGKWIVFDSGERIQALADGLARFIDAGEVVAAKSWNGDPSAICVYSLDSDRELVLGILKGLGAGGSRVWEYDFAWDKNLSHPLTFLYSWSSKFVTILRSYGIGGTLRLAREVFREGRR